MYNYFNSQQLNKANYLNCCSNVPWFSPDFSWIYWTSFEPFMLKFDEATSFSPNLEHSCRSCTKAWELSPEVTNRPNSWYYFKPEGLDWNNTKTRHILADPQIRSVCYGVICQRLMMELLSLMAVMSEGLGFNLCVAPFLNVCVSNLPQGVKDGECQRWLELGWRCHTSVRQRVTKSEVVVRMKANED